MEKENSMKSLCAIFLISSIGFANNQDQGKQKLPSLQDPPPKTSQDVSSSDTRSTKARVAPQWQEWTIKQLQSGNFEEGWGIYSYGGWSDAGQTIILQRAAPHHATKLIVGKLNSQDVDFEREIPQKEFKKLEARLRKINELKDVDVTMFDGIIYEFVAYKKPLQAGNDSDWVQHRVYYKNPGINQRFPPMDALVQMADQLRSRKK